MHKRKCDNGNTVDETKKTSDKKMCLYNSSRQSIITDPMIFINACLDLTERLNVLSVNKEWRKAILYRTCWKTFTGSVNDEIDQFHPIFNNELFIRRMIPVWQAIKNKNLLLTNTGTLYHIFHYTNHRDFKWFVENITSITIIIKPHIEDNRIHRFIHCLSTILFDSRETLNILTVKAFPAAESDNTVGKIYTFLLFQALRYVNFNSLISYNADYFGLLEDHKRVQNISVTNERFGSLQILKQNNMIHLIDSDRLDLICPSIENLIIEFRTLKSAIESTIIRFINKPSDFINLKQIKFIYTFQSLLSVIQLKQFIQHFLTNFAVNVNRMVITIAAENANNVNESSLFIQTLKQIRSVCISKNIECELHYTINNNIVNL